MSFLEHLDELRKRLIASVAAIAVGFLVCLFFIDRIFEFIMRPLLTVLPPGGKLHLHGARRDVHAALKGRRWPGSSWRPPSII